VSSSTPDEHRPRPLGADVPACEGRSAASRTHAVMAVRRVHTKKMHSTSMASRVVCDRHVPAPGASRAVRGQPGKSVAAAEADGRAAAARRLANAGSGRLWDRAARRAPRLVGRAGWPRREFRRPPPVTRLYRTRVRPPTRIGSVGCTCMRQWSCCQMRGTWDRDREEAPARRRENRPAPPFFPWMSRFSLLDARAGLRETVTPAPLLREWWGRRSSARRGGAADEPGSPALPEARRREERDPGECHDDDSAACADRPAIARCIAFPFRARRLGAEARRRPGGRRQSSRRRQGGPREPRDTSGAPGAAIPP